MLVLHPKRTREVWTSRIALWDVSHFKDVHTSFISRSFFRLRWSVNSSSPRVDNKCDTSYTHLDYLFFTNPVFTVYSLPCLSMFMTWSFLYLAFLLVCFIFLFDAGPSLAGKLGRRLYMHLLHTGIHQLLVVTTTFFSSRILFIQNSVQYDLAFQ